MDVRPAQTLTGVRALPEDIHPERSGGSEASEPLNEHGHDDALVRKGVRPVLHRALVLKTRAGYR